MTRLETLTLTALLGLAATAPAHDPNEPRPVDLAICLDTSGSMEGLIHAARQNIWAIVNDLALATPTPRLRIALVTFGNDDHDEEAGWVEVQTAFTDDLDLVSSKLFGLGTNGGNEYVGRVLQTSLQQLDWSTDADALKALIAGTKSDMAKGK